VTFEKAMGDSFALGGRVDGMCGFYVGDFFARSAGANWSPNKNVTIRPEIRYDWFNGVGMPFNAGSGGDQLVLTIGAIVQF
jgi:hypothetical protein